MKLFCRLFIVLSLFEVQAFAQEFNQGVLSFREYLGYVKKYHPLVSRANLEIDKAQAGLMQARGAFDPKIELDFDNKQFRGSQYYSILNSSFKIPTWYGIEVKAAFDDSQGIFVNPQNLGPNQGIATVGFSVPVAQGLFINQRIADLKSAKLQIQLSESQRRLLSLEVLYKASIAYFAWLKHFNEVEMYKEYLFYSQDRYKGVLRLIQQGDKPAIDSIETGIAVKTRELNLENAILKLNKSRLDLANYLWINDVPIEPAENLKPEISLSTNIEAVLNTGDLFNTQDIIASHPKLRMMETKIGMLDIERRLKANYLLPKIDLGYYYLSEPLMFNSFRNDDYKVGLNFSFPIFLRGERGSLNMTKLKLKETKFELQQERLEIQNKIDAQQVEKSSFRKQSGQISNLVNDYKKMLEAEERLFSFGESSIFILNSRENNLISAKIQQIDLENSFLVSNADLFRILATEN
jgi:outer membrane protein TolC